MLSEWDTYFASRRPTDPNKLLTRSQADSLPFGSHIMVMLGSGGGPLEFEVVECYGEAMLRNVYSNELWAPRTIFDNIGDREPFHAVWRI